MLNLIIDLFLRLNPNPIRPLEFKIYQFSGYFISFLYGFFISFKIYKVRKNKPESNLGDFIINQTKAVYLLNVSLALVSLMATLNTVVIHFSNDIYEIKPTFIVWPFIITLYATYMLFNQLLMKKLTVNKFITLKIIFVLFIILVMINIAIALFINTYEFYTQSSIFHVFQTMIFFIFIIILFISEINVKRAPISQKRYYMLIFGFVFEFGVSTFGTLGFVLLDTNLNYVSRFFLFLCILLAHTSFYWSLFLPDFLKKYNSSGIFKF